MALSGNVLGDLIQSEIDSAVAAMDDPTDMDETDRNDLLRAIGNAIVTHITTAGVVNVTSVSGVTTGSGTSGPGAGTIS